MSTIGTFNQSVRYSTRIGGYRRVFEGHVSLLVGGFSFDLNDLPEAGNVLPAGTPVYVDEVARTIKPLYGFKVLKNDGTALTVEKGLSGTRAKVGMTIEGQKVASIDKSDPTCDVLTMAAAVTTAKVGGVVYGVMDGKDIKTKVNALTPYDTCLDPHAVSADGDGAWASDFPVLETRMPPITDEVKKALNSNGCFFRFSNRH